MPTRYDNAMTLPDRHRRSIFAAAEMLAPYPATSRRSFVQLAVRHVNVIAKE